MKILKLWNTFILYPSHLVVSTTYFNLSNSQFWIYRWVQTYFQTKQEYGNTNEKAVDATKGVKNHILVL